MKAETGVTASGERSRIRDARPPPYGAEPCPQTVSSTFLPPLPPSRGGLAASLALGALSAHAAPTPFPADFRSSQVVNADAAINGPRRRPRAPRRADPRLRRHRRHVVADGRRAREGHTVVVPDLRGMGLSSHPAGGYDKWTQAGDIRAVLDSSASDRADIVGHDIGTMVAYAYARAIRTRQPPGRDGLAGARHPPWNQIVRLPPLWHFNFGGPDAERLVAAASASTSTASGTSCRRPVEDRRSDPRALRRDLRQARRDAFRVRPVPRDRPEGRGRQPQGDGDELAMPVLAIGAAKAFAPTWRSSCATRRRTCRNSSCRTPATG